MNKLANKFLSVSSLVFLGVINVSCASNSPEFKNLNPFNEIPVAFEHQWDEKTHPFSGAAVIDINNDGKMELFVGGGNGQNDALLSYQDNRLIDIIENSGLSQKTATYGSASIDIDNDGDIDLIVARDDGVYQYINENGRFTGKQIPLNLPKNSVPFSIAISDIDHDGDADLYISVFVEFSQFRSGVFNDPDHAKHNIMLLNNGDLSYTDITASSNTAGKQNTFLSVFTDLDNDGWQDLVLSQNTGEIEIFRNNKDTTFTPIPVDSGFGFWMGLAVGDIDKDGDQDLFFSNIGGSIPAFITTGDIADHQRHTHDWLLLKNDGDFKFSDVTKEYGLDKEGFSWGAVFEDLNLDAQLDLLVAQNYIKWPIHKVFKLTSRNFLQTQNGQQLLHHDSLGLNNPHYGQSPVIVDLNHDTKPDVLWLNMNGQAKAFLNPSDAQFLSIIVEDNAKLLGTRIHVEITSGKSYTKEVMTSTGMATDQTPNLVFGLGQDNKIKRIVIFWPDGSQKIIEGSDVKSPLLLKR